MATKRRDGRWCSWVKHPNDPSKRLWGYGKSPEDADADLAEKLQDYQQPSSNPFLKVSLKSATLHDVASRYWVPHLNTLTESTKTRYLTAYRYIPDDLRRKPVTQIKRADIADLVAFLSTCQVSRSGRGAVTHPMAPKTIQMVVSILRQILTMAYDAELVDRIVADRAKLPKRPAKRQRVLEPSDAVALFESVKGTEIELPVFLATVLGLRRAEICGLSWNDLDRQRKELRINQQAQKRKGKGTVTTKLKTEGSKRTLHLPDAMMKQLDDLGNIESLYICGLYKTEPLRPDWITRMWVRHRPANLEDWTFHDLRHASAYLLYSVTNNLETVRNVLGHADPDMSMAYIGSNRRNQEAAINAVAQALGLHVDK